MNAVAGLIGIAVAALVLIPLAVIFVMYVLVPVCKGIGWCVGQVFRFIGGEIGDLFRMIGAIITAIVFAPLIVGAIVIGRWSASAHFGRAFQGEIKTAGTCIYRMLVGHPARLLCLTSLTEGIENRLPEVVAATPGRDKPKRRAGQFEGYTIIGSLPGGGSGGKLYVAQPDPVRLAAFARQGQSDVGQVVIKSFSLSDGSSLPQIVRESRSLDAAKKLGLVLDHELNDQRFYYVMRYVPGESLSLVTQRLHADSGSKGLGDRALADVMRFTDQLLTTLQQYHQGGLWHKDVKPDNIIVDGHEAHLVDFGLLSSLRSSMTLTTHGTEYFRDPEMVRMALKGVKVHQVNGAKFDVYATGAVLFSMIENSFPAHGGLSQITNRCPEALRWVVRRAMTDYDKRYESAGAMLADVRAVTLAKDPFAVKPVDLPSMKGGADTFVPPEPQEQELPPFQPSAQRAAYTPPPAAEAAAFAATPEPQPQAGPRSRPKIKVSNWWTGRYEVDGEEEVQQPYHGGPINTPAAAKAAVAHSVAKASGFVRSAIPPREARTPSKRFVPAGAGHPLGLGAREQVDRARGRAAATRQRAMDRAHRRPAKAAKNFSTNPNTGVAVVLMAFLGLAVLLAGGLVAGLFMARGPSGVMISGSNDFDRDVPRVETITSVLAHAGVAPAPSSSSMLLDGSTAVVLHDSSAYKPKVSDSINSRLSTLFDRGVDLVGFSPKGYAAEASEKETDLLAELKFELGLKPWQSESAREVIYDWLDHHDEIDSVIWIENDPKDEGAAAVWCVKAPDYKRERFDEIVELIDGRSN